MKSLPLNSNFLHIPHREVKVWAWILMLTLAFNASFSAFSGKSLFANSNNVLLCAAGGYKSVLVLSNDATEKSLSHCVFCINTDDDSTTIPFIGFDAERVILASVGVLRWDALLLSPTKFLFPLHRAPPVFS